MTKNFTNEQIISSYTEAARNIAYRLYHTYNQLAKEAKLSLRFDISPANGFSMETLFEGSKEVDDANKISYLDATELGKAFGKEDNRFDFDRENSKPDAYSVYYAIYDTHKDSDGCEVEENQIVLGEESLNIDDSYVILMPSDKSLKQLLHDNELFINLIVKQKEVRLEYADENSDLTEQEAIAIISKHPKLTEIYNMIRTGLNMEPIVESDKLPDDITAKDLYELYQIMNESTISGELSLLIRKDTHIIDNSIHLLQVGEGQYSSRGLYYYLHASHVNANVPKPGEFQNSPFQVSYLYRDYWTTSSDVAQALITTKTDSFTPRQVLMSDRAHMANQDANLSVLIDEVFSPLLVNPSTHYRNDIDINLDHLYELTRLPRETRFMGGVLRVDKYNDSVMVSYGNNLIYSVNGTIKRNIDVNKAAIEVVELLLENIT